MVFILPMLLGTLSAFITMRKLEKKERLDFADLHSNAEVSLNSSHDKNLNK